MRELRPMQVYGDEADPTGGVYAIVCGDEVVYVGRSRDVRRRLSFMLGPLGPYREPGRFGAVWLVATDDQREQRTIEQHALDTYGTENA